MGAIRETKWLWIIMGGIFATMLLLFVSCTIVQVGKDPRAGGVIVDKAESGYPDSLEE